MDMAVVSTTFWFFFNCFFYTFALCLIAFMVTTHSLKIKLSALCGLGIVVLTAAVVAWLSHKTGEYVLKDGFNWWTYIFDRLLSL